MNNMIYNINNYDNIELAFKKISEGDIIIYPTDTLYGFGVDAVNSASIKKLNQLKQRNQVYSIIVSSKKMLYDYIEYFDYQKNIINQFFPGPFTLIFQSSENNLSELVNPGLNTLGVRIPNSKFILDVVNLLGRPIITTSVNIHGNKAMQNLSEIKSTFNKIPIFHGPDSTNSLGSTIIDVTMNQIKTIRLGDGVVS